ncbi:hypothetical protein [Pseudomonas paracarnis]|uniref:hypothetical protein n=1 Tax=Pseudomonas paracarnis TaxID=2750625 RepID=UPI001F190DE7|nr:hypothetical protein [Pseudomonas paracarnis]
MNLSKADWLELAAVELVPGLFPPSAFCSLVAVGLTGAGGTLVDGPGDTDAGDGTLIDGVGDTGAVGRVAPPNGNRRPKKEIPRLLRTFGAWSAS